MAQATRGSKRTRQEQVVETEHEAPVLAEPAQENAVVQEEEVPEAGIVQLDRLCAAESNGGAGLSKKDLTLLREAGIHCVDTAAFLPLRKIKEINGIGETKANRIKNAAMQMVPMNMMSAAEFMKVRESMVTLTTGSGQLDALLRGGVETGGITEIFGEFRSGKTQLCHTLCVTVQLPIDRGGADRKALYIDTEGTFRPERLQSIAERYGMDPEAVLNNVTYARAYNCEHQDKLLIEAASFFVENQYGLLIIDSATALFRTDYVGRSELAERQQALNQYLRKLQRLADEHGCAVVITNQVMAKPDGGAAAYMGPQIAPIGGHIIAHASQTRLMLKKAKGDNRICKVFDSPKLPEAEATFAICEGGVKDPEDEAPKRQRH
eukprot:gnl/MRDRNA2_/MRDRNA2_56170_c0_seq1.p1 gnl/MRDRNA2_/MRDRNA2_56170_c0~~gnl/MRDRNA2_/MRDRNA2_56170_c0_seq1.p1  ORF type:complete len:379 (-),score=85.46 gnl/MRDRNA2_/MRDRNA2_56170_c0_seq1:31-1167(-)